MDHMIKEKFIVTDGEKVTDEIYRVTGLDIEIDQIIENISSEESNIYFFDCACLFSKRNTDITSNIEKA